MRNQSKQYSAEFKQDAVNYYYSCNESCEETAKKLKVAPSSLNRWINNAKKNDGIVAHRGSGNYSSDTEKENAKLRRELKNTKDALEILKKAIGILKD